MKSQSYIMNMPLGWRIIAMGMGIVFPYESSYGNAQIIAYIVAIIK